MKKVIPISIILLFIFSCCNESESKEIENVDNKEETDIISEHDTPDKYWYTGGCEDIISGTCCVVNGSLFVQTNSTYTYSYRGNQKSSDIKWEVVSGDITLKKGQGTHQAIFYIGKNFTNGAIQAYNKAGLLCSNKIEITKLEK
ncbi:hypothetical protein L1276_001966 [Flavobacterium sp. HSC-32F16]|uniref:hypothetical protein n=1 Tax=Flavobacterium sp. HSC-32F16 TaxID=2910964 RepID=UPI0020A3227F|nr:hypothetical protein [Flavobacterium sp. HSC-32F16]MCP2026822.1 hypothetical protein [Flavobacterium sp. HSC-32F16]